MKKRIRLTESDLHRIVKESVQRILNEAGHIYGHHEDGTLFTNSDQTFHGIPGSVFIWHGEWSDPTVYYDGEEMNGNELDDTLWDMYKEECEEDGTEPTLEGFDNMPTQWFQDRLDDIMFGMFGDNG